MAAGVAMAAGAATSMMITRLIPLATAVTLLSSSTMAQTAFADPATGFGIAPRAPFISEPTSRRQFDVGVGIKSTTGQPAPAGVAPYVCEAGFKAAPQNNGLSREAINAQMDKPEWANLVRATIELAFTVTAQQRFTLQGYRGIELRGAPKAGPGHEEARMFMSMVETPKGRVTMVCVTERNGFARALPQFRALRATLTLPK